MTQEEGYFSPDLTDRERASFEMGIKLGALYHILCGIPVSSDPKVLNSIEKGIEASISCQPFVKSVKVNLDPTKIKGNKSTQFDYDEITGRIIHAEIILIYNDIEVIAKINWIEDMEYPLMYITNIKTGD
ncbi:MAG: dihydroneopterin aldolase family protein [Promethearchaeota archaeon]